MDTPVHRGGRVSAAALLAAVALSGCGGDDSASNETQTSAAPTLSAALAEELALLSDDVAELVEAGDGCAASARVADLRERTLAAVENGDVPPALEQPLVAAVEALESKIVCEPATTEEKGDEDEGKAKKDRDSGKGKAKKDKDGTSDSTTGATETTETVATTTEQG